MDDIRICADDERAAILAIVNAAAEALHSESSPPFRTVHNRISSQALR
jgi:hypothetical protein